VTAVAATWMTYQNIEKSSSASSDKDNSVKSPPPPKGERPIPVYTAQVTLGDMPVWIEALGRVTPRQQVVIRSRIDGELQRLHFNEGQFVHKGQLLAEIDPRSLQTQLAQQKAQLAQQQSLLNNAKRDLKRYDELAKDEAISTQQRDTQASLVQQTQASLDTVLAQIKNSELQLSYTKIHAPLTGKIGFRQVDVGNQIKANDNNGMATIVEIDPITVVFSVPESYLNQLNQGQQSGKSMTVEVWNSDKSQNLASSQHWIMDNQVDASTGSIRLKAFFANPNKTLTPNQFVQVRIQLDNLQQVLLIPSHAILFGSQGDYVYRVSTDNHVEAIPVKRQHAFNDQIAIKAPLNVGDLLVTDGSDRLKPGSFVKAVGAKPDKPANSDDSSPKQTAKKPTASPVKE